KLFRINLDKNSASYRELAAEVLKAFIKALEAIQRRHKGEIVETPVVPEFNGEQPSNGETLRAALEGHYPSLKLIRSVRRRGRGQVLTHLRQELTRAVRLRDEGVTTRRAGLLGFSGQSIRDGDNRDRTEHRVGLDLARRLVPVYSG